MSPRGIDHIVHAVRDLDAAAALYRQLGFTVGARNRHPWGTHNYVVQFAGAFVELLTLAEPEKLGDDAFSACFGIFTRHFLARQQGLSMLILRATDASADEAAFRRAGIGAATTVRFERAAQRPDGATVKVAFSLAFAEDDAGADIGFAVCQHHYPENFWNPAFQNHVNGAQSLRGVVIVAEDPARHRDFLQKFIGATAIDGDDGSVSAPGGAVEVVTPQAFTRRFGVVAPNPAHGARLAAIRLATANPAALQAAPPFAGLAGLYAGNGAVIAASDALGAVLVFEPAG